MGTTVAWAVGASALLVLLYQHVRIAWPGSYFSPQETLAQYVSLTGLRYAVFRFLPPYLAFLAVGIYAPHPTFAIVLSASFYALWSIAASLLASLRGAPGSVVLNRRRAAVLVSIVAGIAVCAFLAALSRPAVAPVAPTVTDIISNMIAAIIAAVLAISYFRATDASEARSGELADDIVVQVRALALENGVEQRLALTIAYVENAQRPSWFRVLERLTASFNRDGSFGLFQVRGHGRVSDVQSARIAMERLRGAYPLLDQWGFPVEWSVKRYAEHHNPDAKFASMVAEAYSHIPDHVIARVDNLAPDGRSLLDIGLIGRFAERLRIRGSYWADTEEVSVEAVDGSGAPVANLDVARCGGVGSKRRGWFVDIPAEVHRVLVRTASSLGDCATGEGIDLDLRSAEVERDLTLQDPAVDVRANEAVTGADVETRADQ